MSFFLAVLLAAAAAQPVPPVLLPSEKWTVDYGDNNCMLARQFGTGKDRVLIGWRAYPLATTFDMLVNRRAQPGDKDRDALTLSLASGARDEGYAQGGRDGEYRTWRFTIDTEIFRTAPDGDVLTIAPAHGASRRVRLDGMPRALEALAACNDDTAKQWGVDPDERRKVGVAATASGREVEWITFEDYPKSSLNAGEQGRSTILWTIGLDGKVHDCHVVISSHSASLDEAACHAITKRARYVPATDKEGKPMVTHAVRSVVWSMP